MRGACSESRLNRDSEHEGRLRLLALVSGAHLAATAALHVVVLRHLCTALRTRLAARSAFFAAGTCLGRVATAACARLAHLRALFTRSRIFPVATASTALAACRAIFATRCCRLRFSLVGSAWCRVLRPHAERKQHSDKQSFDFHFSPQFVCVSLDETVQFIRLQKGTVEIEV